MNLKAVGITEEMITPGHANQILEWDPAIGEPVAGEPLRWKVKRDVAAKSEIFIREKQSQEEAAKLNVWVVWATLAENYPKVPEGDFVSGVGGALWKIPDNGWRFKFVISPNEIIYESDLEVPNLEGANRTPTPGNGKISTAEPTPDELPVMYADTAGLKWDVSRRVSSEVKNPDRISFVKWQPLMRPKLLFDGYEESFTRDDFPTDPAEANDDPFAVSDEDSNPYYSPSVPNRPISLIHERGEVTSTDAPQTGVTAFSIPNPPKGFSFENYTNFQEFVRLEIAGDIHDKKVPAWFRISEYVNWHFVAKMSYDHDTLEYRNDGCATGLGHVHP